jgi:endoglucanase
MENRPGRVSPRSKKTVLDGLLILGRQDGAVNTLRTTIFSTRLAAGLIVSVLISATLSQGNTVNDANKRLTRTVNFGNALEAPKEGEWGLTLEERYFELIKKAGFTAIRLPVKFSAHALEATPFTLDETFMKRIDWAVRNAASRGLAIIVDLHHYDGLLADPPAHRDRFVALWRQIAVRYKNQPASVMFELCNEPNGKLEPYWNDYLAQALAVVRQTNPTRAVIVGPVGWNSADQLESLKLPDDPNLIVTFHNYTPFEFTHQGAEWINPPPPVGKTWTGTDAEKRVVTAYLEKASLYAKRVNTPIFMGEFGAYNKADAESRVRWTTFTRQEAEKRGFSWAYWEFGAGFGVYDRTVNAWRKPLLEALMSR